MATNKPPQRRIQGIRGSIPSGYFLGRVSAGEGDVELIAPAQALGNGLFPSTKISLVMPAQFSVAGSPITNNGTFTVTWANESPNLVLAGPASGGAATPTFRALVAADIPNLGANPSATASDVAVNGSAATYMRSDGAPAIQKCSASLFGLAKVDGTTITASGGVISAVGGGVSMAIVASMLSLRF